MLLSVGLRGHRETRRPVSPQHDWTHGACHLPTLRQECGCLHRSWSSRKGRQRLVLSVPSLGLSLWNPPAFPLIGAVVPPQAEYDSESHNAGLMGYPENAPLRDFYRCRLRESIARPASRSGLGSPVASVKPRRDHNYRNAQHQAQDVVRVARQDEQPHSDRCQRGHRNITS